MGSGRNNSCVIPDDTIRVREASTHGHPRLEDAEHWTVPAGAAVATFPARDFRRGNEIMGAAVGYYLELCLPDAGHRLRTPAKEAQRALYVHMCWVVLEVTCLLCEYWRGTGDAEERVRKSIKRTQCAKSPLGAAELYFSYFCWRVLGFERAPLRAMSFENWHQLYMWDAANCADLFERNGSDATLGLLADLIAPDDMYAPSPQLIAEVGRRMTRVLRKHITRLADHLCGRPMSTALGRYFLMRKNIPALAVLVDRFQFVF